MTKDRELERLFREAEEEGFPDTLPEQDDVMLSLTMTVRELDAVAFACLREHAKLGLLRRSQPELKGLEEAYALYSGLLSKMLALQKEFS
jgi:hypothetical protein